MDCSSTRIKYAEAKVFSHIVLDYLSNASSLQSFYLHPASQEGLAAAIEARRSFPTDRKALIAHLKEQYEGKEISPAVSKNIGLLGSDRSFTITTAHQPNIFTGPLYFLYKILHAVRLAERSKELFPQYDFVPVYYMGSEDADLAELGQFHIKGEKFSWDTKQTGAVGRMKVDEDLLKLLSRAEGQLSVLPFGNEVVSLVRKFYQPGVRIQEATFGLVDALFSRFGLIVLVPDAAGLKAEMRDLFRDDILHQTASGIVETIASQLKQAGYKVQANPREINLFYLGDGLRGRIEKVGDKYLVHDADLVFTEAELLKEIDEHPEKFSPNVILRGLYQETILPNIAFVGGGGELAYWLQLKELFANYKVPFPVLVLRNSFTIIEKKIASKINGLGLTLPELFLTEVEQMNLLVTRDSAHKLKLNGTYSKTEELYDAIKGQAVAIDKSLEKHVEALKVRTLYRLQELEKKMLRAEKRKFADAQRQLTSIRQSLFPNNGLQERVENFMQLYANYGPGLIQILYDHSLALEQEFVLLSLS